MRSRRQNGVSFQDILNTSFRARSLAMRVVHLGFALCGALTLSACGNLDGASSEQASLGGSGGVVSPPPVTQPPTPPPQPTPAPTPPPPPVLPPPVIGPGPAPGPAPVPASCGATPAAVSAVNWGGPQYNFPNESINSIYQTGIAWMFGPISPGFIISYRFEVDQAQLPNLGLSISAYSSTYPFASNPRQFWISECPGSMLMPDGTSVPPLATGTTLPFGKCLGKSSRDVSTLRLALPGSTVHAGGCPIVNGRTYFFNLRSPSPTQPTAGLVNSQL